MSPLFVSVLLALQLAPVLAVPPTVSLGYSSYQGTPYANGVSEWLGMRYAAPPTGALRFAAPQDPNAAAGVTVANKVCIETTIAPLIDWSPSRGPEKRVRDRPSATQSGNRLPPCP